MKRFFAGLLAVCLVGAAFAGCSGSSANYNVNDVASAVETVAKIENPLDITEDDLTCPGWKRSMSAATTSRLRWKITKTVLFP